jgi:hypothetical protein
VKRSPAAHTFLLVGLDFLVGPAYNVILVGDPQEHNMQSMLGALKARFLPNVVVSMRLPDKAGLATRNLRAKPLPTFAGTRRVCLRQIRRRRWWSY